MYWDPPFLFEALVIEGIRLASIEEIGTMKLDVIARGGRKKDFWDLVEILEDFSLKDLKEVYNRKKEYINWQEVAAG